MAIALAGCPADSPSEPRERVGPAVSDAIARKQWLQPTEPVEPDLWLASRDAGHDVAPTDPAVAGWHVVLADADERFGETDRMIANRAVQLEAMLRELGAQESPREILADFAPFAEKGSRAGFSDLCQHYYNLRSQGVTREAALASLRRERADSGPDDETTGATP